MDDFSDMFAEADEHSDRGCRIEYLGFEMAIGNRRQIFSRAEFLRNEERI